MIVNNAIHLGIIPARAGSSIYLYRALNAIWDHPRACGEQEAVEGMEKSTGGSSPRVRGAADLIRVIEPAFGIIPARAGSSSVRP